MQTLQIELDHSRWFGRFVVGVHGLAVVAMVISQVNVLLKLGVGLAIVCAGVVCWCDLQTGSFYRRLRCDGGQWQIDCGEGWQTATLLSPVVVWHWFAVLRFRGDGRYPDRKMATIVLPDMLTADAFRRLRVLLRLGYGFPVGTNDG